MSDHARPRPQARPGGRLGTSARPDDRVVCERGDAGMCPMPAGWGCSPCGFKTDCCGCKIDCCGW